MMEERWALAVAAGALSIPLLGWGPCLLCGSLVVGLAVGLVLLGGKAASALELLACPLATVRPSPPTRRL